MKESKKKSDNLNVIKSQKKINEEHLNQARQLMGYSNHIQSDLAQLEVKRIEISDAWREIQRDLNEFKSMLRGVYGTVNINLQDGSIEETPKKDEKSE